MNALGRKLRIIFIMLGIAIVTLLSRIQFFHSYNWVSIPARTKARVTNSLTTNLQSSTFRSKYSRVQKTQWLYRSFYARKMRAQY